MKTKVFVCGLGQLYRINKVQIRHDFEVVGYYDADPSKASDETINVEGGQVTAYDSYDYALITADAENALHIRKDLVKMGVPDEKIKRYRQKDLSPFLIDPNFFQKPVKDPAKLFKENVEAVYLELSSKCNRRCWFCPDAFYDRHSENHILDRDLLIKVLTDLRQIDYDGLINLSKYNEPLLYEGFEDSVKLIRSYLPNATLQIITNGDYLTYERMLKLIDAGIDKMIISVYALMERGDNWDYTVAHDAITKKAQTLNIVAQFYDDPNPDRCISYNLVGDIEVMFTSWNPATMNLGRGGITSDSDDCREGICAHPYLLFILYHNGEVVICSNFFPELDIHKDLSVGNVRDNTIFEIFAGEKATEQRQRLLLDYNGFPCKGCKMNSDNIISNNRPLAPLVERPRVRQSARKGDFF